MPWGVCSLRVSLRRLRRCRCQGVSAAVRVQPAGRWLKSSSPVLLGGGSLRRPLVPAGLPSSLSRHAGLAPFFSLTSAPQPGLCLCTGVLRAGSVGVQLRPPALLTCDPCPLQGLVDDKRVSPAFAERDEGSLRATVRIDFSCPGQVLPRGAGLNRAPLASLVCEQQRRSRFLVLP